MLPVNQKGQPTHNVIPHGQIHRHNAPSGPYQHQPFPTVRYGPGGKTTTVNDEEELAALSVEWREFPYPTAPAAPAIIVGGAPSLPEQHAALLEAHANLRQSHDALANDKATLQGEVESLSGELRQAEAAYGSLQKQHAMVKGQLAAARKKDPTVATAPDPAAGSTPDPAAALKVEAPAADQPPKD